MTPHAVLFSKHFLKFYNITRLTRKLTQIMTDSKLSDTIKNISKLSREFILQLSAFMNCLWP